MITVVPTKTTWMRLLAAVTVVLTLGLTACQTGNTVATVAGDRITEAELDELTAKVAEASGDELSLELRYSVLTSLIAGDVSEQAGNDLGISFSEAQLNSFAERMGYGPYLANPEIADLYRGLARWNALATLSQERRELTDAVLNVNVEVNPRYGDWDPTGQMPLLPTTGSLSVPAMR